VTRSACATPAVLDELSQFLAIPSVSADPSRADDVQAAAEWLCERVAAVPGGEASTLWRNDRPIVVGEIRATRDARRAPTVLVYGHFDVQSPEPLELWESPPFEATVRNEWLYARGAADDKGQLYLLVRAAADLAREGSLPVNVRFVCDGEEEVGGHSVVDYLASDSRGADACVIFDTAMPGRGVPAFVVAMRGLLLFRLHVRTGVRDLHSGVYGGAALNAIHVLSDLISGFAARDGRLAEPLRAGVEDAASDDALPRDALPSGAEQLAAAGGAPADARAAEELQRRTWLEPSLDVHGVRAGSLDGKTIVPAEAEASFSIRLAPGQDPGAVAGAMRAAVERLRPEGAAVQLDLLAETPPAAVRTDHPALALAAAAFERALGAAPVFVRSGGTLPIVAALSRRGIPAIVTGFDLPEGNIHSPNERLLVEHVELGLAAARELFVGLADLHVPHTEERR
jgi:acetylornithine deacetylase/succinyl-diaminopimelate desuccinylase-like protein